MHDQCNRIKSPQKNPSYIHEYIHIYMYSFNLQQRNQDYTMGKNILCDKPSQEKRIAMCKTTKLDHCFRTYTKINSKWIKHLLRPETIKLEENIGSKLLDTDFFFFFFSFTDVQLIYYVVVISAVLDITLGGGFGDFFNWTPKAKATQAKIKKWDYIKLKLLCISKENHRQNQRTTC